MEDVNSIESMANGECNDQLLSCIPIFGVTECRGEPVHPAPQRCRSPVRHIANSNSAADMDCQEPSKPLETTQQPSVSTSDSAPTMVHSIIVEDSAAPCPQGAGPASQSNSFSLLLVEDEGNMEGSIQPDDQTQAHPAETSARGHPSPGTEPNKSYVEHISALADLATPGAKKQQCSKGGNASPQHIRNTRSSRKAQNRGGGGNHNQ